MTRSDQLATTLKNQSPTAVESPATAFLKNLKHQVAQTLPSVLTPEKFCQLAMTQFRINSSLVECLATQAGQMSLFAGMMQAAREGLVLGEECFLVPRKNTRKQGKEFVKVWEASYYRHYTGDLALARRSGEFANIALGIVHEHDEYHVKEGTENILEIKRNFKDRGKELFFWCATKLKTGESSFTIMTIPELNEFRDRFAPKAAFDNTKKGIKKGDVIGPWIDDPKPMQLKTILRQHLKYQPKSAERINWDTDGKVLQWDQDLGEALPMPELQELLSEPEATPPKGVDPDTGEIKKTPKDEEKEKKKQADKKAAAAAKKEKEKEQSAKPPQVLNQLKEKISEQTSITAVHLFVEENASLIDVLEKPWMTEFDDHVQTCIANIKKINAAEIEESQKQDGLFEGVDDY